MSQPTPHPVNFSLVTSSWGISPFLVLSPLPSPSLSRFKGSAPTAVPKFSETTDLKEAQVKITSVDAPTKTKTAVQGGFLPVGTLEGGTLKVWSNGLQMFMQISPEKLFHPSLLTSICTSAWLFNNFKKAGKKPEDPPTVDYHAAGIAIQSACLTEGRVMTNNTIGAGVWREGKDYIINSRQCFRASDRAPVNRFSEDRIYMETHDLGIKADQESAKPEEVAEVLEMVKTFTIDDGDTSAKLIVGWLGTAYVTGMLKKRTHIFMSSKQQGTGKSALADAITWLLGGAAVRVSRQNENGIRQAFKDCSRSLIGDEASDDLTLINYLRRSYDGSNEFKGTQVHEQVEFVIRTSGFLCGVDLPKMSPQDASRFVVLNMQPFEKLNIEGKLIKPDQLPHRLFPSEESEQDPETLLRAIGKRFFARMLDSLPRFNRAYRLIHRSLQASGRASDTLAPLIAGAWVMLHDGEATKEIVNAWIATYELEGQLARITGPNAGSAFLDTLMTTRLRVNIAGKNLEMNFEQLCAQAAHDEQKGPWKGALIDLGVVMRIKREKGTAALDENGKEQHQLCFRSPIVQGFTELFKSNEEFAKADIREKLKGIPDAVSSSTPDVRFSFDSKASASKNISIPYRLPGRDALRAFELLTATKRAERDR